MPSTNVSSKWVGGNLYFYDQDGNEIVRFDGVNRKLLLPSGSVLDLDGTIDGTITAANLPTNLGTGFIPLDLASLRVILSNDFADETVVSTGSSEKASGGILAVDGVIASLERVNGATDKAARVVLKANTTGEFQFGPVALPPDLDDGENVTVHLLAEMGGATDTPTIDIQAFAGKGDTEMGGVTGALSNTLAEVSTTLTAANIPAHPSMLNIALVPGAHANDAIWLYAAWLEYTRQS